MSNLAEQIQDAVDVAHRFATIDGEHHKMWVIDQMIRYLLGEDYDNWVEEYNCGGTYEWNTGIAP